MGDLPCRIAQAHTAAEQTRKWDEGDNREKSPEGNQGNRKFRIITLPPPKENQRSKDLKCRKAYGRGKGDSKR